MTINTSPRHSNKTLAIAICLLAGPSIPGCGTDAVDEQPKEVMRFSDEDAERFTMADLENPNIVGRLTPEQRQKIVKEGQRKARAGNH